MIYGEKFLNNDLSKLSLESFLIENDNYLKLFNDNDIITESVSSIKEKIVDFFKGLFERIKKVAKFIIDKVTGFFNRIRSKISKETKIPKDFINKSINNFTEDELDKIYSNGSDKYDDFKLLGFNKQLKIMSSSSIVTQIQEYVYANANKSSTDEGTFNLYNGICDKIFANFDNSIFDGFDKNNWDQCMINNKSYPVLDTTKFKYALSSLKPDSGFNRKKFIEENIHEFINNSQYQKKAIGGIKGEFDDLMVLINAIKSAAEKIYKVQSEKGIAHEEAIRQYYIFQAFQYTSTLLYNIHVSATEYLVKSMGISTRIVSRAYAIICTKYFGKSNVDNGIETADNILG